VEEWESRGAPCFIPEARLRGRGHRSKAKCTYFLYVHLALASSLLPVFFDALAYVGNFATVAYVPGQNWCLKIWVFLIFIRKQS
jgi:hypothetical protein